MKWTSLVWTCNPSTYWTSNGLLRLTRVVLPPLSQGHSQSLLAVETEAPAAVTRRTKSLLDTEHWRPEGEETVKCRREKSRKVVVMARKDEWKPSKQEVESRGSQEGRSWVRRQRLSRKWNRELRKSETEWSLRGKVSLNWKEERWKKISPSFTGLSGSDAGWFL